MEINEFDKKLIKAGLTKKEFAKKVEMNPNSVTNWSATGKVPNWVESWLNMYIIIQNKEDSEQKKLKKYDNHILYNAAIKIHNIPNWLVGKKEFDLNIFVNAIKKEKYRNKIKEEIERNKKFYKSIIINGTVEKVDMFSDLELELIHDNLHEFERMTEKEDK